MRSSNIEKLKIEEGRLNFHFPTSLPQGGTGGWACLPSLRRVWGVGLFLLLSCSVGFAQKRIDGKASYYSNSLHGRRMSSGKAYHRDSLTCAHRTLPFGTKLRVTNPSNGREVIVEVSDRGPYSRNRVIDLSYAAARELGIIAHGVKYVHIEVLPPDVVPPLLQEAPSTVSHDIQFGIAGVCNEFVPQWRNGNSSQDMSDSHTPSGVQPHAHTTPPNHPTATPSTPHAPRTSGKNKAARH